MGSGEAAGFAGADRLTWVSRRALDVLYYTEYVRGLTAGRVCDVRQGTRAECWCTGEIEQRQRLVADDGCVWEVGTVKKVRVMAMMLIEE